MDTTTGIYRGFIEAVSNKDLDEAERFVDASRYRENCIGFTHGFVDWEQAKASIRQVWKGLPDLRVVLPYIMTEGNVAIASPPSPGREGGA